MQFFVRILGVALGILAAALVFLAFSHQHVQSRSQARHFHNKNVQVRSNRAALAVSSNGFLLYGHPFDIWSGSLHYFRIPAEYWLDRLEMAKHMGLNTISTYVPWNFHEVGPGSFDFETHAHDLARFLNLAHEVGLRVLIRPSPYICAEWDFGGLPARLMANPDLELRSSNDAFLDEVERYYDALMPILRPLQASNGGPIIAFYVENEYGSYGADRDYLQALVAMMRDRGIVEQMFTCDNAQGLSRGALPGALQTINFQDNVERHLDQLAHFQPDQPLMVSEYWTGWFDHDGEEHHTFDSEDLVEGLQKILDRGASFNLYVFHGGTSFGWNAGANSPYAPDITSYDYDAPLSEHGQVTPKYEDIQMVLMSYGAEHPRRPHYHSNSNPYQVMASHLTYMEELPHTNGQGYVLYSTNLDLQASERTLVINGIRDRVIVYCNGQRIALLPLKYTHAATRLLDLLVENAGRINYGEAIGEHKGLDEAFWLDEEEQAHMAVIPWDRMGHLTDDTPGAPRLYRAFIPRPPDLGTGVPDTYIDTRDWGRGAMFLNGFNLGRFSRAGPQWQLYLPGPFFTRETNELVILETDPQAEVPTTVKFLDHPLW
ncbi:uncharacterized protein MONBRDRAFT_26329 [Monosiga brevicollis MX1]|uniref:Beta-galactosidase n=1 Tax=Monosiga brevicollis TaxID=81824 RepID=A9V221_MONBE|nr:uncharacterized protein MONBRDRAFT_26329 [Monosiga brevicollis MX1]EDQ88666.1 predicted protein [Monosiga brevicollis MX1]|eukprot:XP_001746770.1 hypothetical protein [Monosiga brevicollis MX1]